ncbi:hypothetical protein DFH06DRAFT_1143162 [Mycena polygramma]|nr:hypothetical protein DFH06DRAFT_1143162 [Mycena polygramma]
MSSSASELDRSIQTFFACIRLLDPSLESALDEDGLWTGYIWVQILNKLLSPPNREHLQHMLTEIGASNYADSVAEDLQQHYYDLRRQTYLVIKTMQELATQRESAKDQLDGVNDHLLQANKDIDGLHEQLELQETQLEELQSSGEAAEKTMQVLNLPLVPLFDDQFRKELEDKLLVTERVLQVQKNLAAHGQSEGKKNAEKLSEKETIIFELEIKLKNEQQKDESHKRQLQEKQQQITGLQKEVTELEKKSAEILNLEMALTQEKETNAKTTEIQAKKMIDDRKAFDALNLELAQSKGVLAQTQRELTETLQVIETKNSELHDLQEELANTDVPEQSSLADQTTISDLQTTISDLHNVIKNLREESSELQEALASERSYCLETVVPNFCIVSDLLPVLAMKCHLQKRLQKAHAYAASVEDLRNSLILNICACPISDVVCKLHDFRLNAKVIVQSSESEKLVTTMSELKKANEDMETAQEELQQQIASQTSQIQAKESDLSNLQSQHVILDLKGELQEQIRAKESQLEDLQTQNDSDYNAWMLENDQLKQITSSQMTTINELWKENLNLQTEDLNSNARSMENERFREFASSQKLIVRELQKKLAIMRTTQEGLQQHIEAKKTELIHLQSQHAEDLAQERAEVPSSVVLILCEFCLESTDYFNSHTIHSWVLQSNEIHAKAEDTVEQLQLQIEIFALDQRMLLDEIENIPQFVITIGTLVSRISSLRGRLVSLFKRISLLNTDIAVLKAQNDQDNQVILMLEAQAIEERGQFDSEIEKFKNESNELNYKIAQLRDKYKDVNEASKRLRIQNSRDKEALVDTQGEARQNEMKASREIALLKEQLTTAQSIIEEKEMNELTVLSSVHAMGMREERKRRQGR